MATELATRPPAFVDGKSLSANDLRLNVLSGSGGATPLQSRAGVRPSGGSPGLVAALATPVMKVRVNAGIADVPSTSVTGGFYRVSWDQVDLDIDVSSAQARIDLIIVEVVDTGTSAATGKVRVLKGASGAGRPSNLVVNAHWFSLAATAVRVNAEGTGNIRPQDVTPEFQYAVAPGARIPVRNQTERLAMTGWEGLEVRQLDTGQDWDYRSGAWTWPKAAQGVIGYAAYTNAAAFALPATFANHSNWTINGLVIPAGRRIRMSFEAVISSDAADTQFLFSLYMNQGGGGQIRNHTVDLRKAATQYPVRTSRIKTPAGGSWNFVVASQRVSGTGNVGLHSLDAAEGAAELVIEDLGAV